MRKIGNVLLDLEPLLDEMVDAGLQTGDILALVKAHLDIHRPDAQEEYEDGTHPEYYYGPKE
jgi:hypothetical protein